MAEKFRVVGRKNHRRRVHDAGEVLDLRDARVRENVAHGRRRFATRRRDRIRLFLRLSAGDAMIFDAGEAAMVRRGQMRFDVVEIQIETDVAVEIAIVRVAGITFVPAPDLAARNRDRARTRPCRSA